MMRFLTHIIFLFFCLTAVNAQNKPFNDLIKKMYFYEDTENYLDAKNLVVTLKKEQKFSERETNFLNNYILFYDFLLSENQELKTIEVLLQNMLLLKNRKPYESELLVNLYSQKYQYLSVNSSWEKVLEVAAQGYFLNDFNQVKLRTKTDYLYDLGFLYDKVGNSFEGIKFYKKSLALYIKENGENNTDVALNYNNLAYAYTNVYDMRNVIFYYQKAAKIWENIHKDTFDRKDYLLTVHQNLMFQFIEYGDIESAKKALEKFNFYYNKKYQSPTDESKKTAVRAKIEWVYVNAKFLITTNEFDKAKKLITTLEKDKNFDATNISQLRYLLGSKLTLVNAMYDKNIFQETIAISKQSLQLATTAKYNEFIVSNSILIALSNQKLKQYQEAIKYLALAQSALEADKFSQQKYRIAHIKADIFRDQNDTKNALLETKNNIENLVFDVAKKRKSIQKIQINDFKDLVSTPFIILFVKSGKMYFDDFKKTKNNQSLVIAENLYKISSSLFKKYYLQGEYNDELNDVQSQITEGLFNISLEKKLGFQGKIDLINTIEENASQHLFKEYQQKINLQNNKNYQLANKIQETEKELNFYKSKKSNSEKDNLINEANIKSLTKALANLQKKSTPTEQNIFKTTGNNFKIQDLLPLLKPNEVVLKYYVTSNFVFRAEIASKFIQISNIGTKNSLEQIVKLFTINNQNIQANQIANLGLMHSILLPKKPAKFLTIIPDNFLNYIPFETLFDKQKQQHLVQNHIVAYEYTLPFLLLNKQFSSTTSGDDLVAFSPNYNQKAVSKTRAGLSNLLYAKQESKQIVNLFSGTFFGNEQATKSNFLNEMQNFGVYHLAMHSQLFEDDFNKSCLVFSNQERVYFSDFYGLNFPAKMVVLSACDTGNGALKSGEGLMSISRALTSAGVKATVKSLWQVPDLETSEIMIAFYENLKKGQAKDEALANAKRTFIQNNPLKSQPYFWAGFVVNGNVAPITSSNLIWFIVLGVAVVCGIAFGLYRKKSKPVDLKK
jgi:CHAT domain-containing protein